MDTNSNSTNNGSNNQSSDKSSNDSKDNSKDSNESTKTKSESSTADNNICRICMNEILHRSMTDTCLHEFCFNCLYRWSRQHNLCPFCRQIFRNIICNIRRENDFDQIPIDVQIGNIAPNNVRTADEALYNNNEVLLQQYSILRNLAVAQLATLNAQLVNLEPNSYEALDIRQRIANVEQRRDYATQMIDQMFANMVRLNANLLRPTANNLNRTLIQGSRLGPIPTQNRVLRSLGAGRAFPAITYNRPIGPIQEVQEVTPQSAEENTLPALIVSPRSPTDTVESDEVEVINVVINDANQNQMPIPLNSGQNAENNNNNNANQTLNALTDNSSQNSTNNNTNAVNTENTLAIAEVDANQQVVQAKDNTGSNQLIGPNQQQLSQAIQDFNAIPSETQVENVQNQNQIPVPLDSAVNNSNIENVDSNQSVDTNQNNVNAVNTETISTVANTNQQIESNIELSTNPIPVQNTAVIIANDNGAQTVINLAANDINNSHSDDNANNSTQQQQQQNQQQNDN